MNKGKEIFSGTLWTTLSTVVTAVVQILRLSILTNYLTKSDFGVVAVLTIVLGLTHTFSDLGFASAIMHKRDLTRKDFSSLYWLQLFVFGFIYLVVIACSSPIAAYFNEPTIVVLLPLSMFDLVLQGFGRLYDTLLQRSFKFKLLAFRNIISAIVSLVIAVVLAALEYGVYSLVLSTLAHSLILNAWNLIQGQNLVKLKFYCAIRPVWPLMKIGVYQTGTQILDYISSKLDILIIGRLLGMENLGVYNLAKELIVRALQLINTIANRVILPYFSSIQNDNKAMREHYCLLIKYISVPNFMVYTTLGVFCVPIVQILYGAEFVEVSPILAILSLWGLLISLGNPVGNVVIAKGRTDLSFRYTIIRILVSLPAVYFFGLFGLNMMSWGQVFLALFMLWLIWYMQLHPLIHLRLLEFIKSFDKGFILSTLIICSALFVNAFISSFTIAVSVSALLFLVYVLCWYLLNKGVLRSLMNLRRIDKEK